MLILGGPGCPHFSNVLNLTLWGGEEMSLNHPHSQVTTKDFYPCASVFGPENAFLCLAILL